MTITKWSENLDNKLNSRVVDSVIIRLKIVQVDNSEPLSKNRLKQVKEIEAQSSRLVAFSRIYTIKLFQQRRRKMVQIRANTTKM